MRRLFIVGGFLALGVVLVTLSFKLRNDTTRRENQVSDRGQTPTQDPRQTLNRGRLGFEDAMPAAPETLRGVLVDAGCPDRGEAGVAPEQVEPMPPARTTGSADRAAGAASEQERAGALQHLTPDVITRQPDEQCAVTGGTRAFALYVPGRVMKRFDEGGNTKAAELFQSIPQGREVLNGQARGAKPRVSVTGRIQGDRIVVQSLEWQQ